MKQVEDSLEHESDDLEVELENDIDNPVGDALLNRSRIADMIENFIENYYDYKGVLGLFEDELFFYFDELACHNGEIDEQSQGTE